MVHTVELSYTPVAGNRHSLSRFIKCFNDFKKVDGVRFIKQENTFAYYGFVDIGIKKIEAVSVEGIMRFRLESNLERLIEQNDRIKIYKPDDFKAVSERFNSLIDSLNIGLPHFQNWKVTRIDYCVNVSTSYVKEYIHLLHKSDLPPTMRGCNIQQKIGSLYAYNGNTDKPSICINIYDKYSQWASENANEKQLKQAENILRVEVQCLKPKTEYLKKKYSLTTKNIPYFLTEEMGYNTIISMLNQVSRRADFQRHEIARQKIVESNLHKSTKEKLIRLIDDIAKQRQNIVKVRNNYITKDIMSQQDFSRCLKQLEALNINPVTIPDNQKLEGKKLVEGLENLHSLVDKFF